MSERFVAPFIERRPSATIGVDAALSGDVIHVGQPLSAHHGAQENTSAVDRALGLLSRMGLYILLVLVLSVTLVMLAGGGALLAFALFSGVSLVIYYLLDGREYTYSRNGLERHKVDTLAELKELEMEQAHELRRMIVEAQIIQALGSDYARTNQNRLDNRGRTATDSQRRITG